MAGRWHNVVFIEYLASDPHKAGLLACSGVRSDNDAGWHPSQTEAAYLAELIGELDGKATE